MRADAPRAIVVPSHHPTTSKNDYCALPSDLDCAYTLPSSTMSSATSPAPSPKRSPKGSPRSSEDNVERHISYGRGGAGNMSE